MTNGLPAVFLDRDGVLNVIVERDGRPESPRRLSEFRLVADAHRSVARLKAAGLPVFVVTNQPDLSRGLVSVEQLDAMMQTLTSELGIDAAGVCPHEDRDACACRKPRPGLILDLADRWRVDPTRSFMVGDTWRDMDAGRAAGCRTVLLRTWYNDDAHGDVTVDDLSSAVDRILAWHAADGDGRPASSRADRST
jgi:D-glycero-D-manno-heptose 1,7-bisphosphate phosphatase